LLPFPQYTPTSRGCFMKGAAVAASPANMSSMRSVVMDRDM
jgi:hypothetical protein